MMLLKGIIENGQVVLPQPANLPDGTAVTVLPHEPGKTLGLPDEEWPTSPDDIAAMLARIDRLEPFDMSPAEEADALAWRQTVKDYTLAKQDERIHGLFE
jgi:hypothetical protein